MIKQMEAQEIFNKVATHLFKQGGRSMKDTPEYKAMKEICAYRGKDGMSCAVGCLISDDDYNPDMEGKTFDYDFALRFNLPDWMRIEGHIRLLLRELQVVHDAPTSWDSSAVMRDRLKDAAKAMNLSYPNKPQVDSSVVNNMWF